MKLPIQEAPAADAWNRKARPEKTSLILVSFVFFLSAFTAANGMLVSMSHLLSFPMGTLMFLGYL